MLFLLSLIGVLLCPLAVRAETGYELFSWKVGSQWRYAIIEGTSTVRTRALRSTHQVLKNDNALKGRIATLPSGEKLYWRTEPRLGFILPPHEVIAGLEQFATGAHIQLLLPGQNTDSKALEQLQNDAKQILE